MPHVDTLYLQTEKSPTFLSKDRGFPETILIAYCSFRTTWCIVSDFNILHVWQVSEHWPELQEDITKDNCKQCSYNYKWNTISHLLACIQSTTYCDSTHTYRKQELCIVAHYQDEPVRNRIQSKVGTQCQDDRNYYDLNLNEANMTVFNE